MAQWIRPQTLNREVTGSNLLAATVVPLGKALYPHCIVPRKRLKSVGPLVACLQAACFLSGQVKKKKKKNPKIQKSKICLNFVFLYYTFGYYIVKIL